MSSEENAWNDETGDWLGVRIFMSNWAPEKMKQLVADAGYSILESTIESQLEGDHEVRYHWILAQLPGEAEKDR